MTFSKSRPTVLQIQEDSNSAPSTPEASPLPASSASIADSYWSWTVGLTTFPFFLWGCPFYLVTGRKFLSSNLPPTRPIFNAKTWWRAIFDCSSVPFTAILSALLLIPTVAINAYVCYIFGDLFNSLFISGTYKVSSFSDVLELLRYLPVVVPLDYVWLKGFQINNLVNGLNSLYRAYDGVGCGAGFRIKLLLMLIAVTLSHTLRYFAYLKYDFSDDSSDLWTLLESILQFSLDIFCSFLLPLYCTFCYAIMFQLYVIKAFIYKLISQRVLPNIGHLSVVKILYTQAADNILAINGFFSIYLSAALLIMILGTIVDAQSIWKGFEKIFISGANPWGALVSMLTAAESEEETSPSENRLEPQDVREINANIACILLIYGLIFFTIRQAISTNDCVRELNVWLNDFVTGGGGTDVVGVLASLGALKGRRDQTGNGNAVGVMTSQPVDESDEGHLIWAKSTMMSNGMDDEFLRKFRNLKAYIHVRMELEKPALLNIALVGVLAPSLKGRLKNYDLYF